MNLVALDDHMLTSNTNAVEPRAHRPHQNPAMTEPDEIIIPADPNDPEDVPVTRQALERGQRARLIRQTRTKLGLSQPEFAITPHNQLSDSSTHPDTSAQFPCSKKHAHHDGAA
jgi:hypothetical protein